MNAATLRAAAEHREAQLTEPQRALWAECLDKAGGLHADPAQLVGILDYILAGRSAAFVRASSRPVCGAVASGKDRSVGRDA